MNNESEYNVSDFSRIRVQLDEILVEQISRLIEIDLTAATLSFNLATITCLLILVEREREIQQPHLASASRYNMETLLQDLEDLGLEVDDDLLAALTSLAQSGYVEKDSTGSFVANISAFTLVAFLDNLFPGMKGLNLVGYVVQTITEVVTGRRKLEDAKMYLKQTLFSHGVALSKQTFAHSQKESLRNQVSQNNINPVLAEDMQKAYIERLETLKALKNDLSGKPSFISRYGSSGGDHVKIREVFPRFKQQEDETPKHKAEPQPEKVEKTQVKEEHPEIIEPPKQEVTPEIVAPKTEELSEPVKITEPEPEPEPEQIKAELTTEPEEPKPSEIIPEPVKEPEVAPPQAPVEVAVKAAVPEPEIKPSMPVIPPAETQIKVPEIQPVIDEDSEEEEEAEDTGIDDDEIERRIAAFSDELAMTCPVCETGKVKAAETEKGRTYFKCSNAVCNFVSWSKPYNYACPLCSNKFLVEFKNADGGTGLKCPRATCSYTQNNVLNPAAGSVSAEEPKKKKKLVRRIKKKV